MEVFVRDVPEQVTEKGLRNLLQPYMRKISIDIFYCHKQRHKRFAFLIFLEPNDGNRFLQKYGQTKPPALQFNQPPKIQILMTPIYCAISKKSPNQHVLRSLEKEKNDKKARIQTVNITEISKQPPKKDFPCSSVSCGVWSYAGTELVYVPCSTTHANGQAKFGARSLLVRLDSGKRIEFLYSSMYGITMEDAPQPSFTIHLWNEPPRFYEEDSSGSIESLVSRTANLNISSQRAQKRRRVAALTPEHAQIVGICFVYRIILAQSVSEANNNANQRIEVHMRALQKMPGLPPILHQQIDSYRPKRTLAGDLKALDSTLTSLSTFPWRLKFQIRLLVSNGFLTPSQTIGMLPEFQKLHNLSDMATCIAAIQKFRNQIPYAGAETDATDLELGSLLKLLGKAEVQAKVDQQLHSGEGGQRSSWENLAIIHRVTITPAGSYLDGPDPEPMNRILRKYPNHHEFFIRVQFADEDGEPVRFNPQVSNDFIFNERFKSVLRNGITIADRKHDFLGFSHSSLRAQSCWFMAPFIHNESLLFDRQLIKQLGDFTKIRCPAKCAARIGQAFSETPTAVEFPPETFEIVKDVERNGRVFSDGVGTISSSVMQKIWKAVPSMRDLRPTCFQIRFRGKWKSPL
jgi:hypothetical protein